MKVIGKGKEKAGKGKGKERAGDPTITAALAAYEQAGEESGDGTADGEPLPPPSLVPTGQGLAAVSKKLVNKIIANEYIDFNELPPAKGKGRSISQAFEGQLVVVQAADLMQARKTIPDLATWVQCFGLVTAVVARQTPERVPELMAYLAIITKASQKYKWPSWVIYDQNFRMDAAGNPAQVWSKVDPSIYAQCFTGQALSTENWCSRCQSLDHSTLRCPLRPMKRPWEAVFGCARPEQVPNPPNPTTPAACIKFNRYNGDCKFGITIAASSMYAAGVEETTQYPGAKQASSY